MTFNEPLTKEMFQSQLRALLPDARTGAEEIWADFACERVKMEQYVDFTPEPDEIAVSRWYDTLLAGFVLLKRNFSEEVAASVCDLSLSHLCLYPYEMERAGQEMRDGSTAATLLRLMEDGLLDAPSPVFPKLRDVLPSQGPQMTPQTLKNMEVLSL